MGIVYYGCKNANNGRIGLFERCKNFMFYLKNMGQKVRQANKKELIKAINDSLNPTERSLRLSNVGQVARSSKFRR